MTSVVPEAAKIKGGLSPRVSRHGSTANPAKKHGAALLLALIPGCGATFEKVAESPHYHWMKLQE